MTTSLYVNISLANSHFYIVYPHCPQETCQLPTNFIHKVKVDIIYILKSYEQVCG